MNQGIDRIDSVLEEGALQGRLEVCPMTKEV